MSIPAILERDPPARIARDTDEYGPGGVHYLDADAVLCVAEGSIELKPGWVVVWLTRLDLDGSQPVDCLAFPASRVVRIDFYSGTSHDG